MNRLLMTTTGVLAGAAALVLLRAGLERAGARHQARSPMDGGGVTQLGAGGSEVGARRQAGDGPVNGDAPANGEGGALYPFLTGGPPR
jgi:hypothetical protein